MSHPSLPPLKKNRADPRLPSHHPNINPDSYPTRLRRLLRFALAVAMGANGGHAFFLAYVNNKIRGLIHVVPM